MALDLAKYRRLFLEEAPEHLAEVARALLELEKDAARVESIDRIFRMAHSIKSMAASLGYDGVAELAHRLEDRMERVRAAGCVAGAELDLLFRGLDGLERMIETVRDHGEAPAASAALLEALSGPLPESGSQPPAGDAAGNSARKKKVLSPKGSILPIPISR